MVKLVNLRTRCICAVCGVGVIVDVDEVAARDYDQAFAEKLTTSGWRVLVGRPRRLLLCKEHAGAYSNATEDELHFLREKLLAHGTAERFALEFYIHNGRVVTETGSRAATPQEIEMWGHLKRAERRQT